MGKSTISPINHEECNERQKQINIGLDEGDEGWCFVTTSQMRTYDLENEGFSEDELWEDVEDWTGTTSPIRISKELRPTTAEDSGITEEPCSKQAKLLEQRLLAVLLGTENTANGNKKKRGKKGKGGTRKHRR